MDTDSLRIYLSASPQARDLIAQLQCDLSCALDHVRELERSLSEAGSKCDTQAAIIDELRAQLAGLQTETARLASRCDAQADLIQELRAADVRKVLDAAESAPAVSEPAHLVHMPRSLILHIACEALHAGRSVRVTLEDGTVQVTHVQGVDYYDDELPIRFVSDGTPESLTWEYLACDRADDNPYMPGHLPCVSRLEIV